MRTYSLAVGSGGQLQVGGGLPLPVQPTCNGICTGAVFPPLGIPAKTTATVMQTIMLGKGKKLMVPTGVFFKPASFNILGQNVNNTALYAVATDLEYSWPVAQATFSELGRTGLTTTSILAPGGWGTITYSNALGRKFGGPAQFRFALDSNPPAATGGFGPPGNLGTAAAVSLYIIPPDARQFGQAPCTHSAFGGTSPFAAACVAVIAQLVATQTVSGAPVFAAAGGGQPKSPYTATTVGGTPGAFVGVGVTRARPGPKPGNGPVKAGTSPVGTISLFAYGPTAPGTMTATAMGTGITNMASTSGYPWTTGMLTISAPNAIGAPEMWKLTGNDARSDGASGAGVLQMVSGALSARASTGDNANRGWVRLILVGPDEVPALSPVALAATAGLMLLVAGYAMRRRFSA
jgi:hypothetical protein